MTTFKVYPKDKEQLQTLKAVMKALKIKFEITEEDKQYNPEFVAKIKESKQQAENGDFKVIQIDDLWK